MSSTLTRRRFSMLTGSVLAAGAIARPSLALAEDEGARGFVRTLVALERQLGARMGVAVLETQAGRSWGHRADERFPMCSTFKALAAGAVLARVDKGKEDLGRRIRLAPADIVAYSPVTEGRVGGDGMTLADLCEAAVTRSDNTAGNQMLKSIGGPAGLTAFLRALGDKVTRLDRWETALNEAKPGDPRDSTSPAAMAASLRSLLLGDILSRAGREQLTSWLVANKTGDAKLRAGLPAGWRIGDKTGGGDRGTTNDVAIIWPPARKPLLVSVYVTETAAPFDDRNAAIAELGRALVVALEA